MKRPEKNLFALAALRFAENQLNYLNYALGRAGISLSTPIEEQRVAISNFYANDAGSTLGRLIGLGASYDNILGTNIRDKLTDLYASFRSYAPHLLDNPENPVAREAFINYLGGVSDLVFSCNMRNRDSVVNKSIELMAEQLLVICESYANAQNLVNGVGYPHVPLELGEIVVNNLGPRIDSMFKEFLEEKGLVELIGSNIERGGVYANHNTRVCVNGDEIGTFRITLGKKGNLVSVTFNGEIPGYSFGTDNKLTHLHLGYVVDARNRTDKHNIPFVVSRE